MNGNNTIQQLPPLATRAGLPVPPLPRGRYVELPGRGRTFVRESPRRSNAPTVILLHGLGATASLNWFVWAALIFFLVGFHHSPPLDDLSPISPGRRVVGIICLVLLVVMTPPFVIH